VQSRGLEFRVFVSPRSSASGSYPLMGFVPASGSSEASVPLERIHEADALFIRDTFELSAADKLPVGGFRTFRKRTR